MRQVAVASFIAVVWAIVVLSANTSNAQQQQQAKSPQFEVASIKPSDPKLPSNSGTSTSGFLFQITNAPLKTWVEMGLSVRDYALKAPAWLDTARFDLKAKLPPREPNQQIAANQDPKAEMMKALLVERFGLKWHEELQTVSGFELVTDKKVLAQPATLTERLTGRHASGSGPSMINGTNLSMAEFAGLLAQVLGRPVVDRTQLIGGYDIKIVWVPDNDTAAAEQRKYGKQYGLDVDNLPSSVTTALREQLGLRLQSAKVSSRIVVVDHINSQPTEN